MTELSQCLLEVFSVWFFAGKEFISTDIVSRNLYFTAKKWLGCDISGLSSGSQQPQDYCLSQLNDQTVDIRRFKSASTMKHYQSVTILLFNNLSLMLWQLWTT